MKENPRFLPHVLVITGDTAEEREFEIEHPEGCPVICYWSPHMADIVAQEKRDEAAGLLRLDSSSGHVDCYVQYEVENVGLDGLGLGDDPPDDGTYTPSSPFSMDGWRRLPPGRYLIEAWFTPPYTAGPYGEIEAEGGLTLLGPEVAHA